MSVRNRTEAQRQRRIHTDKLERQNERHQTGGKRERGCQNEAVHFSPLGLAWCVCVCTVPYHHSVHMSLFVFI